MDAERWRRIETLCHAALDLPRSERGAYLDRHCEGDAELRRDVAALISRADDAPDFLRRPLVQLADIAPAPEPAGDAPAPIGPYRLIRRLGRGGMGEVHLAIHRTEDLEQEVALKVIRRGRDTDEVLRRFRLERRILAALHHPNIARLLDAGATPDGRPYFVMEYVEGQPIDVYCDERRLPVTARLELFLVICRAVQYAHQSLVVHRDIKPGNILVSREGSPKLLDFGIGKVLSDSDAFGSAVETRTDVRLLTPEYAAPEQIRGEPVTTATDVHGLGVLLYELLTGRHPYRATGETSAREVERAILEATPAGLSQAVSAPADAAGGSQLPAAEVSARRDAAPVQLRRALAGDIDNIVLKALRKEPARRYASAAALADDIRRHLAGLPVSARPDTLGYRVRKFVRRNAVPVAAAAVAVLALGATTVVTLVQSRRVAAESARVTRERDKLLEVRGFLMEMFGATGADRAVGDTVTARRLLDLQVPQLAQSYEGRPELEAEMREVLADGYDRLGLYREAEPLARGALELKRATLGPTHPDVAAALNLVGWITHELGRSQEAESLLTDAVQLRRAAGPAFRLDLARSLNDLGVVQHVLGRADAAEASLSQALEIRRAAHGDRHRAIGITASNLAAAYYGLSRFDDAVRTQELAVGVLSGTVGPNHQRTLIAVNNLATYQYVSGDFAGAERAYRDLLARQIALRGRDDPQTAQVMTSLATAIMARGSGDSTLAEAEGLTREALAATERRLGPEHPEVATALGRLGNVLTTRGELAEAWTVQTRAFEILRGAYGLEHARTGRAVSALADLRWRMGNVDRALELKRRAVDVLERAAGGSHPATTEARASLCTYLSHRPVDASAAVGACARVVADLRDAPAGQARHLTYLKLRLAGALLRTGNLAAADSIVATLRTAVVGGEGGPVARALLDSLSAALASRS